LKAASAAAFWASISAADKLGAAGLSAGASTCLGWASAASAASLLPMKKNASAAAITARIAKTARRW
jgi:hypothetical protein